MFITINIILNNTFYVMKTFNFSVEKIEYPQIQAGGCCGQSKQIHWVSLNVQVREPIASNSCVLIAPQDTHHPKAVVPRIALLHKKDGRGQPRCILLPDCKTEELFQWQV